VRSALKELNFRMCVRPLDQGLSSRPFLKTCVPNATDAKGDSTSVRFSFAFSRHFERFYEKVVKVKADVAALLICFSFRRVLEGWRAVKGGADRQRSS
jgi:hypothetical protein